MGLYVHRNHFFFIGDEAAGGGGRVPVEGNRGLYVVSRCGLAVRPSAGKQKGLGSIRFGCPFSSLQQLWFMDTVL